MSELSPMQTEMIEQGREMKGWWIGTSAGLDWSKWQEDIKALSAAFWNANLDTVRYTQVWNEFRAYCCPYRKPCPLLARHRQRRHK